MKNGAKPVLGIGPVSIAQWVKPLLIGHSACWVDGLKALASLGSTLGLKGFFFSLIRLAGML